MDKASQHTIYVAAKVHAQTAHGLIHLTGTSMLPAGDNNWMSRSDLLTDQITFEEMGQSTRQSVYAVGRVSVQQQGPFVQFSLTIRDLNKLPGVYRVKLSVAEPESVLVVRGLDPVAGACSFSSGQAGSLGSGGCTTVAANATR